MSSRRIVIAGGGGFVGRNLAQTCRAAGDEVIVLTRSPKAEIGGVRQVAWDAKTATGWAHELDGAHAVVNLAGETIAQRWSAEAKRRIVDSRIESTQAICEGIQSVTSPPKYWVNASAVGYYGDRPGEILDESSTKGEGFLADTCDAWEQAASSCQTSGTKLTKVRFGMVLGDGGSLSVLRKLAKLGLGGTVGKGEQVISWIHIEDLVGLIRWAIDLSTPPEVINVTAPNPRTNRDFMAALRRVVHAPIGLPAPAFAVRLMGKTIGPDADLVLTGADVRPKVALQGGYVFRHPDLKPALESLLK